ncbi:MAG: right-handed parallel beta-helix repeat-containing protein, partial [Candidatus Hermodarchaeota archaeon]
MVYIVALLLLIALTKVVTIGGGIMDDDLSIITEQTWEEHAPINIKGNEDFKTTAQNEGWQGDGSLTNPYLIKGLNITTPSYSESVVIKNTDVHFQITNCLVKSYYRTGHCGCWHSGIYFENVSNTLILNNTINSQGGFLLSECVNISFINNKCRGIINFFEISSSKNIQIINNSISTLVSGIGILSSKNILILDNNISKIYFGDAIVLKAPEDSVILGNRIDNS